MRILPLICVPICFIMEQRHIWEGEMKLFGREKTWLWVLMAALAAYTVKSIFVGADIDEAYGVTLGYRLVQGDRLVLDMWEPHQTSGIFTALFIRMILFFTGGSLHFMTILLRFFFFLVQTGIALYGYGCLKDCFPFLSRPERVLFAMIYYITTPKCIYVPEYSNLHMWFSTLLVLFLLQYSCRVSRNFGKPRYLVLAGAMLACDVLAYPGMVLLYPFCAGFILLYAGAAAGSDGRESALTNAGTGGKSVKWERLNWKGLFWFTLPCVAGAALFLAYLFSYMSVEDMALAIPGILGDGSHQMRPAEKAASWCGDFWALALMAAGCAAAAAVLAWLLKKIRGKRTGAGAAQGWGFAVCWLWLCFVVQMAFQIICWMDSKYNSGYPQIIYLMVPLFGLWCLRGCGTKERRGLFMIGFSAVNYIVLCASSNWGPLCLNVYLVMGLLGGLLCWRQYFLEKCGEFGILLLKSLCVIFLLCEVFGRCFLIIGGDGGNKIYHLRGISRQGVQGGILASYMNAYRYNDNYNRFPAIIPAGSKVLYLGPSSYYYMLGDCRVAAPSTISTPEYDENLKRYYELHPERFPDVVVMESCYGDVSYFAEDNYVFQWIAEEFAPDVVEEYPYVRVYRRNVP